MNLDFRTAWCPEHAEPFRAEWPKGAPTAMVRLFEFAVADPRIVKHAGADAHNLDAALSEFTPLCCLIDPGDLSEVYAEAGIEVGGT